MKSVRFIWGMVIVLCLSLPEGIMAQHTIVRGCLLDSLSHEGEPFATIRIYRSRQGNEPVAMLVTDMEGTFEQALKGKGAYEILFSSVGKRSKRISFTLNGESEFRLDTVYIAEDTQVLKGVEVVAQRPLVKMEVDKMSYNTADDVDAKSSTVLEMLRKVPMVTVDGNDNITVNGSSNFKVYVDGKPNVMMSSNPSAVLKNMPASVVKNIEVITNPGVKYDAEGVGGVLNLILDKSTGDKKDLSGYNATVRGMASTKGFGGGAYFSMQRDKFSMTLDANVANSDLGDSDMDVSREQLGDQGSNFVESSQRGSTDFLIKMGNLSLGYEIDSLRQLSATFGLMGFANNSDFSTRTAMRGTIYGKGFGYTGQLMREDDSYSINGSVDYQQGFASKKDRLLTLSYLISTSPTNSEAYSLFDQSESQFLNLTDRYTDGHRNTLENTFQIDYTEPLRPGQLLNVGAKYILRNNSSDSKYYLDEQGSFLFDEASSLRYKHDNHILAGYAEYDAKWGKWGLKGGVRYEYTWQKVRYEQGLGEDFSLRYGNLVPSANLSYALSANQNMGLTYNMRISRPGIGYLNPYVDRTDPTALSYGNTELECEKAHNLSLVYNLFTSKWIVNLTLRQGICDNAIESYSFYKDNLLHTTYGNIVKNRQTGLNAYVNWNAGPKTRIYMNGGVSYVHLKSPRLQWRNEGWQANGMLGFQQTLPWNIRLSVNAIASTKQYNLQGWSTGFNAVMGSVSRSFLKDRLNVSVMGMTPLTGKHLEMKTYAAGNGFINRTQMNIPVQMVGLSISYTFGKQKAAKQLNHKIRNTDVKEVESRTEGIGTMMMQK